jgi:putative alpha-1,2-mannosidase
VAGVLQQHRPIVAPAGSAVTRENAGFDFDGVRAAARAAWTGFLKKIEIGGGTTSQQRLFYTGLYHALLHPNVVSGGQQAQYGTYSGWDIYRTQAQLSALLAPQQMSDSATSMLNDAAQNGGQLPKWSTAGVSTSHRRPAPTGRRCAVRISRCRRDRPLDSRVRRDEHSVDGDQ